MFKIYITTVESREGGVEVGGVYKSIYFQSALASGQADSTIRNVNVCLSDDGNTFLNSK